MGYEMTYEAYRYIFIVGAILAGIMLAVSVVLFFLLKIPSVIGNLTGATARKTIENIRNQNESTEQRGNQTGRANWRSSRNTDKISPSGRIIPKQSLFEHGAMATEKISTQQLAHQSTAEETTLLASTAPETSVLSGAPQGYETTLLSAVQPGSAFTIEYEITYIHTNELIV